ncbi:MAG: sugar phosphate isomerase/epimerase family protein [Clostridiaceae bacterium]|nr:sugar phosphate isomerase/epimerase family protein [Clostridiaceae bacterium]
MTMKHALYSITYLGAWYQGEALSWKDVLKRAAEQGYEGVEFDAKRPHANPMDWDEKIRRAVVDEAGNLGLELPTLSANNDFSSPVPEQREAQLLMVREQIKLASDLGCKVLRVFAAWPGITFRDGLATYDEAIPNWKRCFSDMPRLTRWRLIRDCLKESAKIADAYGVTLALQNHPPMMDNWQTTLEMIQDVDNPALKMCYDLTMHEDNDDSIIKGWEKIGRLSVHYHYNGEWQRDENGKVVIKKVFSYGQYTHYKTFIHEMKKAGYDGWLSFEFCHPVCRRSTPAGIDLVDEQSKLALEFMKDLVENA